MVEWTNKIVKPCQEICYDLLSQVFKAKGCGYSVEMLSKIKRNLHAFIFVFKFIVNITATSKWASLVGNIF